MFPSGFQSTLPARGATRSRSPFSSISSFQSTLPARGATQRHHPRRRRLLYFNPRSPHGERLPTPGLSDVAKGHFNPRSPHGERPGGDAGQHRHRHFNPRSPHGERPLRITLSERTSKISIHAPRTGSDRGSTPQASRRRRFQSTLPARGATTPGERTGGYNCISIHAPRTGSDTPRVLGSPSDGFISIHAPRTGSDWKQKFRASMRFSFQSTLPARGATRRRKKQV